MFFFSSLLIIDIVASSLMKKRNKQIIIISYSILCFVQYLKFQTNYFLQLKDN